MIIIIIIVINVTKNLSIAIPLYGWLMEDRSYQGDWPRKKVIFVCVPQTYKISQLER